jgi:hypothetical protein
MGSKASVCYAASPLDVRYSVAKVWFVDGGGYGFE